MPLEEFFKMMATALNLPTEKNLSLDTRLSDIWDSLGQIMVLSMLSDNFKVTLEMNELISVKTIKDILDILKSRNITIVDDK